jgi:hypothetical protein
MCVCSNASIGQNVNHQQLVRISDAELIYFYGYDISKSKVTDPKRGGQPLAHYMHELVAEMTTYLSKKRLLKWFGFKDIGFKLNGTHDSNISVKSDELFYPEYMPDKSLTQDSIEQMIFRYKIEEKSGIGLVIIYEYFSRKRKSVSGYMCFFDIETREILVLLEDESKDGNSYRSFRDYWNPAARLVIGFTKTYGKMIEEK